MADINDMLTPLVARLSGLTVDGHTPKVFLWNVDRGDVMEEQSWYVTVGAHDIGEGGAVTLGRYQESVTAECVYAVGPTTGGVQEQRREEAAMLQAAIEDFNSALVLASGIVISEIAPVTTAGTLQLSESKVWIASSVDVRMTRWVRYGG